MAWDYSQKVEELFRKALNNEPGTYFGELPNPDGMGTHGSIACGDAIIFYFTVQKHPTDPSKDVIIQARYKTFGCTSAIASSEALCELIEIQRPTPLEALKITSSDIVKHLGGMPDTKLHCSVMGAEVMKSAVINWATRRGCALPIELQNDQHNDEGEIVCDCFSLTDTFLRKKIIELDLRNIDEIKDHLKAGGACGSCVDRPDGLHDQLLAIWGDPKQQFEQAQIIRANPLPEDFKAKIELLLAGAIRPQIKKRGGEIELIEVNGANIYCSISSKFNDPVEEENLMLITQNLIREILYKDAKVITL